MTIGNLLAVKTVEQLSVIVKNHLMNMPMFILMAVILEVMPRTIWDLKLMMLVLNRLSNDLL